MKRLCIAASFLLMTSLAACDRPTAAQPPPAAPAGDLRAARDYVKQVSAPPPAEPGRDGDPHAGLRPLTARAPSPQAAPAQQPPGGNQPNAAPQSQPGTQPARSSAAGSGATVVDAAGLKLTPPAGWKVQPTTSAMRKAQMLLPRAEGDAEDGELIVFHFGAGGGGGVQANIERWVGQFQGADGKPLSSSAAKSETFAVGELKVTWLDVSGRYMGAAMGGPAPTPKDSYRMLAAIVEGVGGPWFIKATGPAATMARHEEAMKTMVKSARQ